MIFARLGEANVFCGDPQRQVSDATSPAAGRVIVIDNLATALAALHEIVVQGEGARGTEVWDGDRRCSIPSTRKSATTSASSS